MEVHNSLKSMLHGERIVRAVGVHDGISAILAERARFDALWISGLCVSTARGVADAGILTMTEFHESAVEARHASSLPIVADVDAGFGDANVVRRMVRLYEGAGIDAVCIEDKEYPKRNSFLQGHRLDSIEGFCRKLQAAKQAQTTGDFAVIARIEALIAGFGMDEAMRRAEAYAAAGADALLVHSKAKTADEIEEFCQRWQGAGSGLPILAVPTTYYRTHCEELRRMGVSGVIYANQAMRAAVTAVSDVLARLEAQGSSADLEDEIASVSDLFSLVDTYALIEEPAASNGRAVTHADGAAESWPSISRST